MNTKKKERPRLTEESTALITTKNAASIQKQAATLQTQVNAISVTNERECQSARVLLTRIITARDKAQMFVKPIIENAKEGLRLAKEQEVQLVGPLESLRVSLKTTINAYLTDVMMKEREQREEQERLKREYEEKIARSKRPERIKEPEIIEEELIIIPKMENTSIPMVPKYEIEDESKVPDEFKMTIIDREKLWNHIRAAHKIKTGPAAFGAFSIPGVRIWEEASLTIRGGR